MSMAVDKLTCDHDYFSNFLPSFLRRTRPKAKVKLVHQYYERSILHNQVVDDDNFDKTMVTPYQPSGPPVSKHFNPFCSRCGPQIVEFFTSTGGCKDCSDGALQNLKRNVEDKLKRGLDVDRLGHELSWCISTFKGNEYYVSDEEELRELMNGESSFEDIDQTEELSDSKEAVEALERLEIEDEGSTTTNAITCVICLEELKNDKGERKVLKAKMPCKHEFHEDCIVQWLRENSACPICRFGCCCKKCGIPNHFL